MGSQKKSPDEAVSKSRVVGFGPRQCVFTRIVVLGKVKWICERASGTQAEITVMNSPSIEHCEVRVYAHEPTGAQMFFAECGPLDEAFRYARALMLGLEAEL